jgi:hypothetical protein
MRTHRSAWNKGRLLGQKPPLKPKEIWSLRIRLLLAGKGRDLALFNLALDSKLPGCDLIRSPTLRANLARRGLLLPRSASYHRRSQPRDACRPGDRPESCLGPLRRKQLCRIPA